MPLIIFHFIWQLWLLLFTIPLQRIELRGKAQGTTWSLMYYAPDSVVTKKHCDSLFASLDSALSVYKNYSEINALNNVTNSFKPGNHLLTVLQKGQAIAKATGGSFDMTILPLVSAWGFGAIQHTTPPDSATVQRLRSCTGYKKLAIKKGRVIKRKPCLQVDVNGIAQGYSVDVFAAFLQQQGIRDFLMEIGGEIRVNGSHQPSDNPFTVGVESPEAATSFGAPLQQKIILKEGALTTSGSYRRYYLQGDKAISHLLDPRTGMPVQNELLAVTVWASDALTADAWDNALMVMGLQAALKKLSGHRELGAYFIYRRPDQSVGDTATQNFAALFVK